MNPEQVTLTYLLDTYKTKAAIAERFGISEKSVFNWFNAGKVPEGRQKQYLSPAHKTCAWCGIEINPRSPAMYCCQQHRRAMEAERLYQARAKEIGYGKHEFDAWVNQAWQGSNRRGHAIEASGAGQ